MSKHAPALKASDFRDLRDLIKMGHTVTNPNVMPHIWNILYKLETNANLLAAATEMFQLLQEINKFSDEWEPSITPLVAKIEGKP
jgi:hypothetical protein